MSMTRGPKRAAATRVLELLVNPAQHPGLEAAHTRVGGKPCPARLPGGTAAGTARLGHSRCSADSSHRVNGVVPLTWQRLPVTHTASSPRAPHRCGAHGSRGGGPSTRLAVSARSALGETWSYPRSAAGETEAQRG